MLRWVKRVVETLSLFFIFGGVFLLTLFVTLWILVPPERVLVPEVVGKEVIKALEIANQAGLLLKIKGKEYSPKIPRGIVISQVPRPGVKVRKGRAIEVVVSKGLKVIEAPKLEGKTLREAEIVLSQEGIEKTISYTYGSWEKERVISQTPPPGFPLNREEGVEILVSLGRRKREFLLPSFVGKKLEQVKEIFETSPLRLGKIKEIPTRGGEEGRVVAQEPPPGSRIKEGEPVNLFVGIPLKEKPSSPKERWILSRVDVPPPGGEVRVKIKDREGEREERWGKVEGGKTFWVSSLVKGKGEIRIFVGEKLIKIKKIE